MFVSTNFRFEDGQCFVHLAAAEGGREDILKILMETEEGRKVNTT